MEPTTSEEVSDLELLILLFCRLRAPESLRSYPISSYRTIPKHIELPDWDMDGIPKIEPESSLQHIVETRVDLVLNSCIITCVGNLAGEWFTDQPLFWFSENLDPPPDRNCLEADMSISIPVPPVTRPPTAAVLLPQMVSGLLETNNVCGSSPLHPTEVVDAAISLNVAFWEAKEQKRVL
uniref:Uncharacterized protein n=1 Tax=Chenopodium quinoa TaxID=63459 RepID=A0A803MDZ2_CHEQI